MPKDYKNINNKNSVSKKRSLDYSSFLGGLLIGLFIALIVYLNEHKTPENQTEIPELVVDNAVSSQVEEDEEPDVDDNVPEPQFDFYTILPSMEVNVSEWVAGQEIYSEPGLQEKGIYILQVGSFKEYKAADEVKANLAFLGINADIQRVVINGRDVHHRVRVGPYKDQDELNRVRNRLIENHYDFILLKLEVENL